MSAPSRSTSHSLPPHGWGRRSRTRRRGSSSRAGRSAIRRVRVSERAAGRGSGRGRASVAGRAIRVDRLDVDLASGVVAASCAMMPPARVSEPVRVSGCRSPGSRTGRRARVSSTETAPGSPPTTVPGTTRTSSIAIASAPALRSSLSRSSIAAAPIGAADRDLDPAAGDTVEPCPGADPGEVGLDLADGRRAARAAAARASSWRWSVAISAPELVVARVEVGDEERQVLCRHAGRAVVARLGPDLGDDEQPEDDRDGGDERLAARSAERRGLDWPLVPRDGTACDSRRLSAAGECRDVDGLRLDERDVQAERARPGLDELAPARDSAQLVEQVRRPDRRDLCTAAPGRPS